MASLGDRFAGDHGLACLVVTEPITDRLTGCAECGRRASYRVWLDGWTSFSCAEPTHWAWVVEAVADAALTEEP